MNNTKETPNKQTIDAEQAKMRVLEPLIRFANANRGTVAELTRRIIKACPNRRPKVAAAHVAAWLHPNRKERVQPRLAIGLVLLDIGQQLMAEQLDAHVEKEIPNQNEN